MDIKKLNEDNIGGNRYLLYVDVDDVQEMVIDKQKNTLRSIGLKKGKEWSRMDFTKDTLALKEDTRLKNGNDFKSTVVAGIVPKDSIDKQELFLKLANKRFIVLVGTRNNELKAIGSIEEPCIFISDKKTTGTKATEAEKQRVSFSVKRRFGAMIFRADLILYIDNAGQLIYDNQFTPASSVSINGKGELVITGPDEDKYFLNQYILWRS